jgi:hypothetical protein
MAPESASTNIAAASSGALSRTDHRPNSRRAFDAQTHAALLAEISGLVGPIAMRKAIGATKNELRALEKEGILIPRTSIPQVKCRWMISDGQALVSELQGKLIAVSENANGRETCFGPAIEESYASVF